MSKVYQFGFFGEDVAQKLFLKMYLEKQACIFQEYEPFSYRVRATNKREVDSRFKQAVAIAVECQLNVLFIGRDSDSTDPKVIQRLNQNLTPTDFKNQTLRLIPVQCIEHWLWYLTDETAQTGKLENKPRDDAKLAVWGVKRPTDERRKEVFTAIRPNFDIPHLVSRSASFRHFHQQVQNFLKTSSQ